MPSPGAIVTRLAPAIGLLLLAGALAGVHIGLERATAAREQALRAALADLRGAATRFTRDTGRHPASLGDLTAKSGAAVNAPIDPARYQGPYLAAIPRNPYAPARQGQPGSHWRYTPRKGSILSRDYAWSRHGKLSEF
jgi:type II secretory pathway pseudopilin PulG